METRIKEIIFEEKRNLKRESKNTIDYDTQWKEIISNLFEDFIKFFLPKAFPLIDFGKPIEFLEQELHKIIADNKKEGKVINDKLVKVNLKNGEEKWILIHIEIQSSYESNFSKRMFVYFYRIFDQYSQEITAIAIYTGEQIPPNYGKYEYSFLGTKANYEFNTYLVKNTKDKELIESNNPFALAVLATRYLHKSKSDYKKRLTFKRKLIRLSKEKNYSNNQIINLLKFIDLILYLPEDLEKLFIEEVIQEFIKKEDMQTLESIEFSNQLHIALYGESIEQMKNKIKKQEEEKFIIEKTLTIQKMIKSKKMSVKEIAEIMNVSKEIVKDIKEKM